MKKNLLIILFIIVTLIISCTGKPEIKNDNNEIIDDREIHIGDYTEHVSERKAFIVGVSKYKHKAISNLSFSVNDAMLMRDTLKKIGVFDVTVLTDDTLLKPTKENILRELDNLIDEPDKIKTFVFYFAGHGLNIGGENYLVPRDVDFGKDGNDDKKARETCIKLSDIYTRVEELSKNAKVMMFLDACRNNPYKSSRDVVIADSSNESNTSNTWEREVSKGAKIFFSTTENTVSYEYPELGHGIYTYYLAKGLSGESDINGNNDGYVSFNELANDVTEKVKNKVRELRNRKIVDTEQVPVVWDIETQGEFILTETSILKNEAPDPPIMRNAVVMENSLRIYWNPTVSAMKYEVYRFDNPKDTTNSVMVGVDNSTNIKDIPPMDKIYYYRVKAYNFNNVASEFSEAIPGILPLTKQIVKIPDTNLEYAIREQLNKFREDIYDVDLKLITKLNGDKLEIESIDILDKCENLKELYLYDNYVKDLSPLEKLENLEVLSLKWNIITDLSPIKNLKKLEYLDISANNIHDITPLSELSELEYLDLSDSYSDYLIDLKPLKHLKELEELNLYNSYLEDISILAELKNLEKLDLSYNSIKSIKPLTKITKLKSLNIQNNNINDLSPLSKLKNLEKLNIQVNLFEDISPLSRLTNLKDLDLGFNYATDISPLQNLKKLEYLNISDNEFESINVLSKLENLKSIELDYNDVNDISVISNLTNLKEIWAIDNNISDITPLSNLRKLRIVGIEKNNIRDISPLKELHSIRELYIAQNNISDLSILENYKNLKCFSITLQNGIGIKDITETGNLKETLDYFELQDLKEQIDFSEISSFENLTSLSLNSTDMHSEKITIKEITNIKYLYIYYNKFQQLSVENIPNLQLLNIYGGNEIEVIKLRNIENVSEVYIDENTIREFVAENLQNVVSLSLYKNSLQNITLNNMPKVNDLWANENLLTDISFVEELTNLEYLITSYNSIRDITPVGNLTNLIYIDVSFNYIEDLAPLVTCRENGGLPSGSYMFVNDNELNVESSTHNSNIIQSFYNDGSYVLWEDTVKEEEDAEEVIEEE